MLIYEKYILMNNKHEEKFEFTIIDPNIIQTIYISFILQIQTQQKECLYT